MNERTAPRRRIAGRRWIPSLLAAACALCALAAPPARAEPIVLTDMLRIRTATDIELAPDGSFAVVAIQSFGTADGAPGEHDWSAGVESRNPPVNQSHLFRIDVRQAEPRLEPLTFGDRMDVDPRLSPDGRMIAFVRRTDGPGGPRPQVWVMPTRGGEARQATFFEHGATTPRWLASSTKLLVTSAVPLAELPSPPLWPLERPGLDWSDVLNDGDSDGGTRNGNGGGSEGADDAGADNDRDASPVGSRNAVRAWLEANAGDERPRVFGRLRFQTDRSLRGPYEFAQFFIVDLNEPSDGVTRLTAEARDHRQPAVDPAGRWVYFVAPADPEIHPDRSPRDAIWRIPTGGGAAVPIVRIEGWTLDSPKPSRDGNVLAFKGRPAERRDFQNAQLGIATLRGDEASEPLWLTEDLDLSVWRYAWRPTESALIFNTLREGGFPLMLMGPGLLAPSTLIERVGQEPVGVHAFDAAAGVIVYAATTASNPGTIWVRDARGNRMLADLHPWLEQKDLSVPEERWIERPDGTRVQYWLMPPTNRRAGASYPAVLEIHGGPTWMWGPGERTMWHEFQLLCSWGYAVVYANPRGSSGYGEDFQAAIHQDWSAGPAGDVLAALDHALLESWIDGDRLAITGGSYGGYLTASILTQDQRFKAAVAQRGVYDLNTFFGEGTAFDMVEPHFGGYPWEARIRPILQRESPFNAVQRIRTPLLIMHADQDLRTGVSQSEMLYRALKQMGRPVEYVRYPGADHNLSRSGDPVLRLDRLARTIEFFERFIENPRPAPRLRARVGGRRDAAERESPDELGPGTNGGDESPPDASAPGRLEEEER